MIICLEGHADAQTDTTKLMVAFLEFAKCLEIWPISTLTSLMSGIERCVSDAISLPSHQQPYVLQTEEFQYGWRFTCDSGQNQRFLGGRNTSSEERSWKLTKYVKRSGNAPSIGNLARWGGQAGDEEKARRNAARLAWTRLANISILFINPSKQACSTFYVVWTASAKFCLHAGNMILIAQIEDWMTVLCLILCAFCTHQGR